MSYSSEVLADSPLAYYRLGEASGTTMVDSSGNGRNGTYAGTYTLGATGLLTSDSDKSVDFTNGYGLVSYASWMNAPTALTITALIRPDALTGDRAIVDRDHSSGRVFQFRISGSKLQFVKVGGGVVVATGATTLAVGTTYHVAVTYDGTTIRLYLNGVLDGSASAAGSLGSGISGLAVGMAWAGNANATPFVNIFDGRLDEVAYYGTVLSGARIAAHYAAGTAVANPSGTLAASTPALAASLSGSFTAAPESGTLDLTLPVATVALSGTYAAPPTGALDADLTAPVVALAGTYAPPANPTGSLDLTTSVPVVSLAGTYDGPDALTGVLTAALPALSVALAGGYTGPTGTDTTNAASGRSREGVGTMTLTPPVAPVPPGLDYGHRVDKAVALPTPTLANGRPT